MKTTIFNREIDAADRERWRQELALPLVDDRKSDWVTLFVFRVGAEWFGLDPMVLDLAEPMPKLHSLPHRGPVIAGVVNVRGTVSLCFSLEQVLSCLKGNVSPSPLMLVLSYQGWRVACKIEEAAGMVKFKKELLHPVPSTLAASRQRHIHGLFDWKSHGVGWIDAALLFQTFEEGAR